jgi:predicted esterase
MTVRSSFLGTSALWCGLVLVSCGGSSPASVQGSSGGTGGSAAGGSVTGGSGGDSALGGDSGGTQAGGSGGSSGVDPNGGAPSGPSSSRHTAKPLGTVPEAGNGFWEYLPPHYGNGAEYPLLVFWHGYGENGSGSLEELNKLVAHGPPKLIQGDQWPEERTFVVLSAQHSGDSCPSAEEIHVFLQFGISAYEVDTTRVYLTGLSCGAIGSWAYLGAHLDETIAALVPVCGDGRGAFEAQGCALGKVPIWAFHGDADETVEPEGSTTVMAGLEACSDPAAVDAKLTVYPGVGHDSWTQTYDLSSGNDIYAWMMTHQKP